MQQKDYFTLQLCAGCEATYLNLCSVHLLLLLIKDSTINWIQRSSCTGEAACRQCDAKQAKIVWNKSQLQRCIFRFLPSTTDWYHWCLCWWHNFYSQTPHISPNLCGRRKPKFFHVQLYGNVILISVYTSHRKQITQASHVPVSPSSPLYVNMAVFLLL